MTCQVTTFRTHMDPRPNALLSVICHFFLGKGRCGSASHYGSGPREEVTVRVLLRRVSPS